MKKRRFTEEQIVRMLRTTVSGGGTESDGRMFVFGNYLDEVLVMGWNLFRPSLETIREKERKSPAGRKSFEADRFCLLSAARPSAVRKTANYGGHCRRERPIEAISRERKTAGSDSLVRLSTRISESERRPLETEIFRGALAYF